MVRSRSAATAVEADGRPTSGREGSLDLLVIGPASDDTGGVARYVDEQRRRLPDQVRVRVYGNGTGTSVPGEGPLGVALSTLLAALAFPFRGRPDVAHVHTSHGLAFYRAAWYVFVVALVWHRPVVVHVHGSSFDEFVTADGVAGRFQRLVFDVCDRAIVLSPYWFEVLSEHVPPEKLEVLPNAVDPDDYEPDFGADPPRVAFVSDHVERKGIAELVAALERLGEVDVEYRATLAGSGPLSERVRALADRSEHVEYLGYVPEARKRELLERATIYVLPSHAEGLPIALLEGMAAGNAVVSTAVGAIPEVVDEEAGRLVAPGDAAELTDSLRELLEDPSTAESMGRHNRTLVEAEYSWSRVVDRLADVYRSLAAGDGPTGPN